MANPRIEELPDEENAPTTTKVEDGSDSSDSELETGDGSMFLSCSTKPITGGVSVGIQSGPITDSGPRLEPHTLHPPPPLLTCRESAQVQQADPATLQAQPSPQAAP